MGNPNQFDWGGEDLVVKSITFSDTPGGTQTALSSGEVSVLDGVTAGTALASKALVLDSSKAISTITTATITNLTSTTITPTTIAGTPNFTGAVTAASTLGVTGLLTASGGVSIPTTKNLAVGAGTVTVAPIALTAGTNLTTPVAGAIEYDGKVFYSDFAASQRGLNVAEQFIYLTSPYTLTSQTTVQKLFNAPTGGALTVLGTTTYMFECLLGITSMSATSGNFKFDLLGGGNATLTASAWHAIGQDAATPGTAGTVSGSYTTGTTTSVSSGDIITASTATVAYVNIRGSVRVNGAGTLIPSILLTSASAAVVGADSYFRCWPIGASTVQSVGNWA